jgi:hypothetical protein
VNESNLIAELRAALDDEAATVRAPAGAAERARTRARGRRLARGLAVGVPAAGLAAGLVLAFGAPHAPARLQPHAPLAHAPRGRIIAGTIQTPLLTAAYVTARASAALNVLNKTPGLIVQASGHGYIQWSVLTTGAGRLEVFGTDGKLASDEMVTYRGNAEHVIYVDYNARTWWQLASRVPVVPRKPSAGVLPVAGDSASGRVEILGHTNLHGTDTILVRYGPPRGFKPTASASWPVEQVWLDATNFLPVRIEIFGAGTDQVQSEQSLTYLQATPANLAKLTVTPPAGFKQVPPPPFRGDGRPGLGQLIG